MITITVDATSIISALLGGVSRDIFFEPSFRFITTEFTINEIKKYLPYVSEKSGVNIKEIIDILDSLPLEIYKENFYFDKMHESNNIIGKIDKKDIKIFALTLKTNRTLWSEDKHFDKVEGIILLKTKDFF